MIKTEKRDINGHTWEVTQWPGRYSLRMQARIASAFGPVLGGLIDGKIALTMDLDSEVEINVAKAMEAFATHNSETSFQELILSMLSSAKIDGKDADNEAFFDMHFAGNMSELYAGIAFVLQVNYGNLFTVARTIIGSRPAQEAKAVDSQGS